MRLDEPTTYPEAQPGTGRSGLGAAVDAASRGHSVCLIERADFAKGTSSRSTKLVHGGVRYLKQGNIALVMEALRAGAKDFVLKPFQPDRVLGALQKLLAA